MRMVSAVGMQNIQRIGAARQEIEAPSSRVRLKAISVKIWEVAKFVFQAGLSVGLYIINPSLFTVGFIIGVVFNEQTRDAIQKITLVWKTQPWGMSIIAGVASFISLPVSLAAGSFIWAAHLGSKMSFEAQQIMRRRT